MHAKQKIMISSLLEGIFNFFDFFIFKLAINFTR